MASSTSHRAVFKFWVACNLVLHTRNEIVICGCVLSATGNFTHSIKNQEYSAVIGVTGYTVLNESPASLTKKIQKKTRQAGLREKRRLVQLCNRGPRFPVKLLKS